jgi:hypothetical protein
VDEKRAREAVIKLERARSQQGNATPRLSKTKMSSEREKNGFTNEIAAALKKDSSQANCLQTHKAERSFQSVLDEQPYPKHSCGC